MTDRIVAGAQEALPHIELTVVSQGAEAVVFSTPTHPYFAEDGAAQYIVKYRPPKPYRHPKIDRQLTRARTVAEAKFMARLQRLGVAAPQLIAVDAVQGVIWMELVGLRLANGDASSVKNWLWQLERDGAALALAEVQRVFGDVGAIIAKLHLNDMVHGDLTTSNIMLQRGAAVLIDFGLSLYSALAEDKAVDMYVLERAVLSTHSQHLESYNAWLLQGYEDEHRRQGGAKRWAETVRRLEEVRTRGRKRSMLG